MNGKTFKKIMPDIYPLKEENLYKVNMWLGSYSTKAIVFAANGAVAVSVAEDSCASAMNPGLAQGVFL